MKDFKETEKTEKTVSGEKTDDKAMKKEAVAKKAEELKEEARLTVDKVGTAVANKAEVWKSAAEKKAEEVKAEAKTKAEAVKAEAEKKAEEVKTEAKQKTTVVKTEAKAKAETMKKETKRKTAAAKAEAKKKSMNARAAAKQKSAAVKTAVKEPEAEVVLQYAGKEVSPKALIAKAIEKHNAVEGNAPVKKIALYMKPEEGAAYYVINDKFTGKVEF